MTMTNFSIKNQSDEWNEQLSFYDREKFHIKIKKILIDQQSFL